MEGRCKLHKNYLALILFFLLMIILRKNATAFSLNTSYDGYSHPSMTFSTTASTGVPDAAITTQSSINSPLKYNTTSSAINNIPKVNTTPAAINDVPEVETTPDNIAIKTLPPKTIPPFLMRPNSHFILSKQYPRQKTSVPIKSQKEIKGSPEVFINNQNLLSSTAFMIWINTTAQKTYIFTKNKNNWKLTKAFICATGKDSTPTIKGIFKSSSKAAFVYDKKYDCYLKYVTQIYNGYLLHSVILDKDGKIIDGTLGRKKSHGCVRLSLDDSKWIYDNVPLKTTIYIT